MSGKGFDFLGWICQNGGLRFLEGPHAKHG